MGKTHYSMYSSEMQILDTAEAQRGLKAAILSEHVGLSEVLLCGLGIYIKRIEFLNVICGERN